MKSIKKKIIFYIAIIAMLTFSFDYLASKITYSFDVGASVKKTNKIWGIGISSYFDLSNLETLIGKNANIWAVFIPWEKEFPVPLNATLKSQNKTLMIFWEQYGVTLDQIISGSSDSYIRQFAASAKAYGGSVILAPFHEMNGNWDPWDGTVGSNTPAKVISAWKHVHDLFAGISNVKFVWAVNNDSVPDTSDNEIGDYYPGDAYVDYVGVDGFNFGNPWQTYSQVFSSALSQLKTYNKPILISSMASAAGSGKAAWITEALSSIYSDPKIAGFVWFNENKEENWLISSDSASLSAFKAGIGKY